MRRKKLHCHAMIIKQLWSKCRLCIALTQLLRNIVLFLNIQSINQSINQYYHCVTLCSIYLIIFVKKYFFKLVHLWILIFEEISLLIISEQWKLGRRGESKCKNKGGGLNYPSPKVLFFNCALNTEFVAALGILRKRRNHLSKGETIQNQLSIQNFWSQEKVLTWHISWICTRCPKLGHATLLLYLWTKIP